MQHLSCSPQELCGVGIWLFPSRRHGNKGSGQQATCPSKGAAPLQTCHPVLLSLLKEFWHFFFGIPFWLSEPCKKINLIFGHSQKRWFPAWTSSFIIYEIQIKLDLIRNPSHFPRTKTCHLSEYWSDLNMHSPLPRGLAVATLRGWKLLILLQTFSGCDLGLWGWWRKVNLFYQPISCSLQQLYWDVIYVPYNSFI